ncbi:MAG: hypothetical protein Q7T01_04040 [bacterium]|nr:hypothetical protein [bacterium]
MEQQPIPAQSAGKPRRAWKKWVGALVLLALIAFIAWQGVAEEPRAVPQALVGTAVILRDPAASAALGEAVSFRWEVRAPVGASAVHTAIHWGSVSVPGTLGYEVAPDATAYSEFLSDYATGQHALPREFTGAIIFPQPGTSFLRAHAVIDGVNVWSPEHQIVIEG